MSSIYQDKSIIYLVFAIIKDWKTVIQKFAHKTSFYYQKSYPHNAKPFWKRCSLWFANFCNLPTLCLYIHTHLPVNAIDRLPHPGSGDSQCQETFLAPSADKRTSNYGTECSNHHPSLSTLRSKGLSRSKMKWWAIYTQIYQ